MRTDLDRHCDRLAASLRRLDHAIAECKKRADDANDPATASLESLRNDLATALRLAECAKTS